MSDDAGDDGDGGDVEGVRVRVAAEYQVEVTELDLLANLVEGRGADRPTNAADGIRHRFESDSWHVAQYPPGRVRLVEANVDISEM